MLEGLLYLVVLVVIGKLAVAGLWIGLQMLGAGLVLAFFALIGAAVVALL